MPNSTFQVQSLVRRGYRRFDWFAKQFHFPIESSCHVYTWCVLAWKIIPGTLFGPLIWGNSSTGYGYQNLLTQLVHLSSASMFQIHPSRFSTILCCGHGKLMKYHAEELWHDVDYNLLVCFNSRLCLGNSLRCDFEMD